MNNLKLSLFKGYFDTSGREVALAEVVRLICDDQRVKEQTEKYRYLRQQPTGKKEAHAVKRGTPCFAVAVRFAGGKSDDHVAGWTGLTLADFDHLPADEVEELKRRAADDPHTLLAYTTISGEGLRILSRVKLPANGVEGIYPLLFEVVNRHYEELLGHKADLQCKNCTRLSGVAHDPTAFYNADAVTFDPLERAVKCARKELERDGVVYQPGEHNRYIMRMGYLLNLYGVDERLATAWALEKFSDYAADNDVPGIIRSCYKHQDEHGTRRLPRKGGGDAAGRKRAASVDDVEAYLNELAEYRWNCVSAKTEYRRREPKSDWCEMDDRFVNTVWTDLCRCFSVVRERFLPMILESDFVPCYHPFEEYFNRLPAWDGHDYIGELAATVHCVPTDEEHDDFTFEEALRHWLVAMVVALFEPEKVNEEILVLVGSQGIYKTTWLSMLLPPELRSYFLTKPNSDHFDKDDRLSLTEFAVVCLEELDVIQPRELSQLKSLASQRRIHERAPYMRYKRERLHIASFCGTSNVIQFLSDRSKNRRWLVFEVDSIDSPYDHPIPYGQLYAQVKTLYKGGFNYWFEGNDIARINRHNRRFELPDLEAELIQHYFRKPLEYERGKFMTAAEIYQRISYGIRFPLALNRITGLMKQLGFKSVRSLNRRGFLVADA